MGALKVSNTLEVFGVWLIHLGYESLLNTKILHRDISIGNVVLNEVEDDSFLIDLDLAKDEQT